MSHQSSLSQIICLSSALEKPIGKDTSGCEQLSETGLLTKRQQRELCLSPPNQYFGQFLYSRTQLWEVLYRLNQNERLRWLLTHRSYPVRGVMKKGTSRCRSHLLTLLTDSPSRVHTARS